MGRTSTVQVDEQAVIQMYLDGVPMIRIAEQFEGMKHHHVDWILRKHGIPKRSNKQNSRKYEVDHHYFDVIDTEEKAYWLGFLAADGYVRGGNRCEVGMSLEIKDIGHVDKFKQAINATYPVKTYEGTTSYNNVAYARLLVASESMKEALEKHGIVEHKTLVLEFPELPEELVRHFIRGYFDGDGSFSYYAKKNQYQIKICGTTAILTGILEAFEMLNQKLYKRNDDDKDNYYISIGGMNQVRQLADYMYDGATIYLERKKEIYEQIKNTVPLGEQSLVRTP
ncbi:LAGLIDADG family homing endonuclease [Cytobacillus oceanisediminis]|uniref:LAGLIDADG family homing endonuclease n=1 Tax=Cytobacillus oceanisediminis TaxID=665099 RepID=UPI001FB24B86|nr:LAGLIDADG family homing endonuclease [Cytobacillus oceanisediminis]UOE58139.1 hypothetical protein IRB79_26905 [Cytobacillus oceanisediminis]